MIIPRGFATVLSRSSNSISSSRLAAARTVNVTASNASRNFHSTRNNMVVKTINSYDEFKTAISGDKPAVLDFKAVWCGPCKMISPIFEKISDTPAGEKIDFYQVDVDDQEQVAQELGIRAMPTFIVFKGGNKIDEVVGADPSKLQVSRKHSWTMTPRCCAMRVIVEPQYSSPLGLP